MSQQKETTAEAKESLAKKIWLAGLGAYGQGFDEAVEQYNKVNEKTSQLFSDLVKKGAELEGTTREKIEEKIEEVKTQSTETIDQRVSSVRQKLGLGQSEEEARLERLEAKLDSLTDAVNALSKAAKTPKKAKAAE